MGIVIDVLLDEPIFKLSVFQVVTKWVWVSKTSSIYSKVPTSAAISSQILIFQVPLGFELSSKSVKSPSGIYSPINGAEPAVIFVVASILNEV